MKSDLQLAREFHYFFEAIPEEKWCVGKLSHKGKHCALGHLGMRREELTSLTGVRNTGKASEFNQLITRNLEFLPAHEINDGACKAFSQPTPRLRILAALSEIIEKCANEEKAASSEK